MSLDDLCERCGLKPFAGCLNGNILSPGKENTASMCPHLRVRLAIDAQKERLSPEIFNAPSIKESPLFVPSPVRGQPAPVNMTKKNIIIRGLTWPALLPHLRFVLMGMPYLRYKIVNDQRIKEVFVGAESYKTQPQAIRESKEINNAIGDLVGQEYDLVIIQLGLLGYKNVAAAGVLKESLMMRVTQGKPTWLFETSDRNISWQYSRDPEVEAYVEDNFESFEMTSSIVATETEDSGMVVEEVGSEDAPAPYEQMALVPEDDETVPDSTPGAEEVSINPFASLPGMGDDDGPKKYKKRPFKKGWS